MEKIYLGIGTNLGDREANCTRAIELIAEAGIDIEARSPRIETPPWGVEEQPPFLNMAIKARTSLGPNSLLRALKNIEAAMGRDFDAPRWGPRIIDLDILLYGSLMLDSAELIIPHPLIQDRAFVLEPLVAITPNLMHPLLKKSMSDLLLAIEK
jgi:2-amino-4-hydroxy-6-hydroxymethyldihydropteridine diphosphokinase